MTSFPVLTQTSTTTFWKLLLQSHQSQTRLKWILLLFLPSSWLNLRKVLVFPDQAKKAQLLLLSAISIPASAAKTHECPLCLYKTEDLSSIKKHYKDIHKERYEEAKDPRSKEKKSKPIDDIPAKYFCTQCPYKTHSSVSIKEHVKEKHKTLFVFECEKCDYKSTESHRTWLDGHSCSKLCLRCGKWHTSSNPCSFSDDVRCLICSKVGHVREAFKNDLQKTYGIFHMLVDPLPPP